MPRVIVMASANENDVGSNSEPPPCAALVARNCRPERAMPVLPRPSMEDDPTAPDERHLLGRVARRAERHRSRVRPVVADLELVHHRRAHDRLPVGHEVLRRLRRADPARRDRLVGRVDLAVAVEVPDVHALAVREAPVEAAGERVLASGWRPRSSTSGRRADSTRSASRSGSRPAAAPRPACARATGRRRRSSARRPGSGHAPRLLGTDSTKLRPVSCRSPS